MAKKKKSTSKSTTENKVETNINENNNNNTDTPKPFDPFENLDDKQLDIFKQFKEKLNELELSDKEKLWVDDMMILRYLRAREYDLQASFNLLKKTLEWRKQYKPDEITAEHLSYEASTGKQYCNGKTKDGKPAIYMRPVRENTKNYERQIQLLVYTLERAIQHIDRSTETGVEQLAIVIDFNGYSLFNAPPMSVARQTLEILSDHYPERLGTAFVVDPPMIFNILYNAIMPFVNPNTAKKIVFVKGEKAKLKTMHEHFDIEHIERPHTGTSEFEYDHMTFWRNEIILDREKRQLPPLSNEELDVILKRKD
ncbi:cellular retinaldehyde-binding/triple function domain-containing protein [Heterostelium album PN500]|uniref:Cellular retinaldehyde-binding/triple function domain-containing protein n=1 Tax=Heterostelium pallidum (strain ATCC 26659 / Pp 5 / PN500) TaxID=670386 RepID=D3BQ72_HETP5|nr:cellular retinaldehyde-binding/triple function domain-containing protein [Heterostelium album PN500]EFA76292.1 cellular retinaldehyde-binding/triple function domain-containing protein [Heterostelium album PN500]|eukprot:XP_020428424.1 cellular retinaldehyde-binding/triple function domain-containing protein [Heterostelium album PN500]